MAVRIPKEPLADFPAPTGRSGTIIRNLGTGGSVGSQGTGGFTWRIGDITSASIGSAPLIDRRDVSVRPVQPNYIGIPNWKDFDLTIIQREVLPVIAKTILPIPPVIPSPSTTVGGLANKEKDVTNDLGSFGENLWNLGTDLGTQYLQSKFGQASPAGIAYQSYVGASVPAVIPQPSVTVIPNTGGPMEAGMCQVIPAGYVYDAKLGCLKKKTRKRRKRLATASDIADLSALKSVLGNGEAFKTWIATH